MRKNPPMPKNNPRIINAWATYDWANSVYPLVISSAVFPIYYGMVFAENNQIDFLELQVTGRHCFIVHE